MVEQNDTAVGIGCVDDQSIVSLKLGRGSIGIAVEAMQLADALCASGGDPQSLWLGPDRWLLVSESKSALAIIDHCEQKIRRCLYSAVDYSAALALFRVTGPGARTLLASGTGLDLRAEQFPIGTCSRTKLAQVAAIIVAVGPAHYDVYVDRSFESYLGNWLAESASILASYRN